MATAETLEVDKLVLGSGSHERRSLKGVCFMEAAAWLAGEKHTDHPECVSPIIGAFMRRWNDDLDDAGRQRLKPLLPLVLNTVSTPEIEDRRGWLCADWMVRVHTPAWLRLAGLNDQAIALESLPEIADVPALTAATKGPLAAASRDAAAAVSAARSAAWSAAARSAAGSAAAGSAARSAAARSAAARSAAARSAAESAAGSAAWSAAAWSAAWLAAWLAAELAAWSAAWSAAELAARSAAGSAAEGKLKPTTFSLQSSALDLVRRMCEVK